MRILMDLEANGLKPDKIWCAVAQDLDTDIVYEFDRVWEDPRPLIQFMTTVSQWVGHYILGYDIVVLRGLLGIKIDPSICVDTLVVSRLTNFARPGGHGLGSIGAAYGLAKPDIDQWDEYDPKMLHRCREDVRINRAFYEDNRKYIESEVWKLPLKIEHSTADFCRRLHENGFPFDIKAATELAEKWNTEKGALEAQFQENFPPKEKIVRTIIPVLTKSGKFHSKDFRWYDGDPNTDPRFSVGRPFDITSMVPFDPASKQQVLDRILEYGWKPTEKTDGHKDYLRRPRREQLPERLEHFKKYGWKLSEANLQTVSSSCPPAVKGLVRWLELTGKLSQLNQWIRLYNVDTKCIHGDFMSIGAWSGRCAHSNPNMANASSDHEVRALWVAKPETVLVGTDASGIQLRVLAHYMDDDRFTVAVQGDPHTLNAQALGQVAMRWEGNPDPKKAPRQVAKKYIYSWLLGAQATKLAEDMECTTKEASQAMQNFLEFYPGLKTLKEKQIPADAQRRYFQGLDGRYVRQSEERLMLAGYLQNGESVVMKLARMLWEHELNEAGIWFVPVNFVHDEFVTLAKPKDAEAVGLAQKNAIIRAGQILKLKCPLDGTPKVGLSWDQVH